MAKEDYNYNGKIINSILCDYGNVNPHFTAEKHYSHVVDYMRYFLAINELVKPENSQHLNNYIQNIVSNADISTKLDDLLDRHFDSTQIANNLRGIMSVCPDIINEIKGYASNIDVNTYLHEAGFSKEQVPAHFYEDLKIVAVFDQAFPVQDKESLTDRLAKLKTIRTKNPLTEYSRDEMARFAGSLLANGEFSNPAYPQNNASSLISNEKVAFVVTDFKNQLCSMLSNYSQTHETLSRGDKAVQFNLLKSNQYRVLSPSGKLMRLSEDTEFSPDGKKTWRVEKDVNNNLIMSSIEKFPVSNIKKNEQGTFHISEPNGNGANISVPEYRGGRVELGDKIFIEGHNKDAILELDENNNFVAVNKENSFTILTGSQVNPEYWAKRGTRGEFSVYGANGLVGHFTTNMTERRKKGVKGKAFHLCQLDSDHSNIIINIDGKQQSVALKEKQKEYQLLIYKDIERKGFTCHFNIKVAGDKEKSGIKGILYPAKGNQPIKFTEKGPDDNYYNTASFFPSRGGSVKGVLRDLHDAMYMAALARKPKELEEQIKTKSAELAEMGRNLEKAGLDPELDQDYCEIEDTIVDLKNELDEYNRTYTKERLKDLNNQTWQSSDIYVLKDAEFLLGKRENSYQRTY